MQTIRSILSIYELERDVRKTSVDHLGYAIGRFQKFLGREPAIDDLNDETVNKFLLWLADNGSRTTMRNYRVRLLTLWRFGVEIGLLDRMPLRVRRVRVSHPTPQAWNVAQVERLLEYVVRIEGNFLFTRVSRKDYWRAVVRTAYDTGFRFGDIMQLGASDFYDGSMVVISQQKTSEQIVRWVYPETWAAIQSIIGENRPRIFGDVLGRRSFFEQFALIRKAVGLPGTFRWLRRSGASLVERDSQGDGKKFLGHKTHGIAERHYFDPRLLASKPVLPPKLVG